MNGTEKLNDLFSAIINDQPKQAPEPPSEIEGFRLLTRFEQSRQGPAFYAQDIIKEYLEKKWKAELCNRDGFLWLWDLYEDEQDQQKKIALNNRLIEFKTSILNTDNPYPALRIDFNKYPLNEPKPQEVDWND